MKNDLLKRFLTLSAVGLTAVSTMAQSPDKTTPQSTSIIQKTVDPKAIDKTYEAIRTHYEGFHSQPYCGIFNGKKTVKIGFGTPIEKEDFIKLESSVDQYLPSLKQAEDVKIDAYNATQNGQFFTSTHDDFRILNHSIRKYTKQYLAKMEAEKYRPLCLKYNMDYDALPSEAKAGIFCVDMATGGRVETYKNFLSAIAKKDWLNAAKQSFVPESSYLRNNPTANKTAPTFFNRSMKTLFNTLAVTKTKQLNIAIHSGR